MTEEDGKLLKTLIYKDANRGCRKGYFNPRKLLKTVIMVDDELANSDDDLSTMEMIKSIATTNTKKDTQISELLKQNNELLKRLSK